MPTGTYDAADLRDLAASGGISSAAGIAPGQIQPSSLDLTLAEEGYRMPGSILPLSGERVRDLARQLALERIDLSQPVCLARNQVYLVRLRETLALPDGVEAYCNGKSSTGRVDLATRVLADGTPRYDRVPAGYRGELWIELIPRSFHTIAAAGVSLNQAIVFRDRRVLNQAEVLARHRAAPLLIVDGAPAPASAAFDGRLMMTADLARSVVGFVAKPTHLPLDLTRLGSHRPADFFEPVARSDAGWLFLEQDRFYILATRERIVVPLDLACEMVPFEATAGEFRAHYAGFFDPGWGLRDGQAVGAPAVLEVRPHQDDLILRHGQPICAMAYETLSRPCTAPYGSCGNTYAAQEGPRLSKHFAE
jgi:dCTP deaminase